jgi:hypothetical protein
MKHEKEQYPSRPARQNILQTMKEENFHELIQTAEIERSSWHSFLSVIHSKIQISHRKSAIEIQPLKESK